MPLKFCKMRWVENRIVLERALEVLPDMAKYIKAVEMKKFPDPKTKSFDVIKEAVHDPLTTAKMNFVLSVAKEVTPSLTKYQCDKPMVAFLATDLFILLKNLMSRFVKVDILKEVKSIDKLQQVQVNKSSNHGDCSKVNVGFVAERIMKDASAAKKATELQVLEFQMSSKKCLVTIVEKLLQKSPLKYSIVSTIRFLDPRKMASSREQCTKWLKKTLSYLEEKKRVREQDCDDIIREYDLFTEEVVASNKSLFAEFNPAADRVDTLLHEQMSQDNSYKNIWELCRKLLLWRGAFQ